MAISKEQIYAAIEAIAATGQKPTTITIREQLGTGSLGTINPVLKEWREQQTSPPLSAEDANPVPQAFIDGVQAIIPQLWAAAAATAHNQLTTERIAWTAEREELQSQLEELTTLEAAANTDIENEQIKNAELENIITALKAQYTKELDAERQLRIYAETATAQLKGENTQMKERLEELQVRYNELKKSSKEELKQCKANLEEMNIERVKNAMKANIIEKENQNLQKTITDLKEELKDNDEYTRRLDELVEYNKAKHVKELAALTKAIHAAEKKAVAAEATAAARKTQIAELKTAMQQLKRPLKS